MKPIKPVKFMRPSTKAMKAWLERITDWSRHRPQLAGALAVALLIVAVGVALAPREYGPGVTGESGAGDGDYERGPHGGRLLREGDFALEITIFEAGRPPQFRVYAYDDGEAVDPAKVDLEIKLERLGGAVDAFTFKPEGSHLAGEGVVREPHSFDVAVEARHDGRTHKWDYSSYEGRTTIAAAAAREAGVETARAGPAKLKETIDVLGEVDFEPGAKTTLRARFPGPVLEVLKSVGDRVEQGELLVRVESNESMQAYTITSPMEGMVLEIRASPGNFADSEPLMVIGDPSRLHVDFHIFASDEHRVRPDQRVTITALNKSIHTETKITKLLPIKEAATQTIGAHAPIPNPEGKWIPGMMVKGALVVDEEQVPLAVRTKALQRFRDFTVVFAKVGDTYEVRMLEIGRQTPEWTEVLGGLEAGEDYVVENSFLIKADIEKSGAAHEH